jgi:hypothetical protein
MDANGVSAANLARLVDAVTATYLFRRNLRKTFRNECPLNLDAEKQLIEATTGLAHLPSSLRKSLSN